MNIFQKIYISITNRALYRMINKARWDAEIYELANKYQPQDKPDHDTTTL